MCDVGRIPEVRPAIHAQGDGYENRMAQPELRAEAKPGAACHCVPEGGMIAPKKRTGHHDYSRSLAAKQQSIARSRARKMKGGADAR